MRQRPERHAACASVSKGHYSPVRLLQRRCGLIDIRRLVDKGRAALSAARAGTGRAQSAGRALITDSSNCGRGSSSSRLYGLHRPTPSELEHSQPRQEVREKPCDCRQAAPHKTAHAEGVQSRQRRRDGRSGYQAQVEATQRVQLRQSKPHGGCVADSFGQKLQPIAACKHTQVGAPSRRAHTADDRAAAR
jgi:hypothetical protein